MVSNHQGTSEVLRRILAAIASQPRLTRESEADLARRAAAGDQEAGSRLVTANLASLAVLARAYRNMGLPMEDLLHEGAIGLLEAVRHFDPERDVRFFTYAAFFVRRTMVAALARSCKTVRVPRHVAARARRLREAAPSADGAPTPDPMPYEVSLDEPSCRKRFPRSNGLQADAGADAAALLLAREELAELSRALEGLPHREREILALRFGLGGLPARTLRQLGADLRLSKERVRQLEDRALTALRRELVDRRFRCQQPPVSVATCAH